VLRSHVTIKKPLHLLLVFQLVLIVIKFWVIQDFNKEKKKEKRKPLVDKAP
jgi:uncharacterized membrane protein YwzB